MRKRSKSKIKIASFFWSRGKSSFCHSVFHKLAKWIENILFIVRSVDQSYYRYLNILPVETFGPVKNGTGFRLYEVTAAIERELSIASVKRSHKLE